MSHIDIRLMDNFALYIDEQYKDTLLSKSRKGLALMQFLIVNQGRSVPNYRLLSTLWNEEKSTNPENALKTLISRMRTTLNQIDPSLAKAIVADRGAYHWETPEDCTIDVYELEDAFTDLQVDKDPARRAPIYEKILHIYKGDLLASAEGNEWALAYATDLHNRYMNAVYAYIEDLKAAEKHEDVVPVCRKALEIDSFDDHLNMELMNALIKTNHTNEALVQYKHVVQLHYRYLGIQPSDDMREFYKQIIHAGRTLDLNLETIRNELRESGEQRGAFMCEYSVFKEIFNLQMRNLERLGSTMFLGVIMVSDISGQQMDSFRLDNVMQGLIQILKENLRKGDTITHFGPNIVALLLPTVDYATGNMVMERTKRVFFRKYPNSNVVLNYRIGPLSTDMQPGEFEVL